MGLNTPLADDDRAIEGLPIRLVIALVVGVATLGIMMNMLTGLDIGNTELMIEFEDDGITYAESASSSHEDVTMHVVSEDGEYVDGATVVVSSGSAQMEGTWTGTTNDDGQVEFASGDQSRSNHNVGLRPGQDTGTLDVAIQEPSGGEYEDEEGNEEILVVND